jgi:biopolymer transport protein ExbD
MADETNESGFSQEEEEWIQAQRAKEAERQKRLSRRGGDSTGAVNINSLMDIMVIMLVFLLKSYGDDPLKVVDEDLKVPRSTAQLEPVDATVVTITRRAILVDDSPAVDVRDGRVDPSQKGSGGQSSMRIIPLLDNLNDALEQRRAEAQLLGEEFTPEATIIADQMTPHRLVLEVLYTATEAQLSNFRFAIIRSTTESVGGIADTSSEG